jgi:hypothetical protein
MTRLVLLLTLLCAGCAALKGQVQYDGPAGQFPTLHYARRTVPHPIGLIGSSTEWWYIYQTEAVVDNPSEYLWRVSLDCGNLVYEDVEVPPRTTQYFLLNQSYERREPHCKLGYR